MSANKTHESTSDNFSLQLHLSRFLFHLQSLVSDDQQQWIVNAIDDVQRDTESAEELANRVISFTARAKRCLGEQVISLKLPANKAESISEGSEWEVSHWTKADLGRLILLGAALNKCTHDKYMTFEKVFSYCDASERKSLINGLYWLLEDERLIPFAEEVQRTNDMDLFAALVAENPFPAMNYSDAAFNQMVLKSLFLGLSIDRIAGLQYRLNDDLSRMCDDYLHERRLAGREIPASLWLALSLKNVSPETQDAWMAALDSDQDEQRYYAARALQTAQQSGAKIPLVLIKKLQERATLEQHSVIKSLVQDMQSDSNR